MTQPSSIARPQTEPTAWATLSILAGILLVVGGLLWALLVWVRISGMNSAPGTIVQLDEYADGSGTLVYLPVVDFKTADGKTVRTKSSIRQKLVVAGFAFEVDSVMGTPNQYHVNDTMLVYYDPKNSNDTQLGDAWQLWATPIAISGLGIVLALVTLVFKQLAQRMTKTA